jgi:Carboxypeptidase regulatory-like domain/Putative zinc-finger
MQNVPKIVRERLKAVAPAVNHPDADLLTAFAERSLPDRERNVVLEHLARCGDCRDIVALALPESEPVQTVLRPSPGGWLTWPSLRWGFVAAGVLAIASFSILQLQRHSQPTTVALKQPAGPEMAANEPKKAVAQFVAPASTEKNEKLQVPAAPAFADAADGANAIVIEKKTATSIASIQDGAVSAQTKSGTNTVHGAIVGGPALHGPRVANQWQQTNAAQNQLPAPTPQEFAKQQRAEADTSANERMTTTETASASGAAPAMAQPAPQSPSGDEATYLTRAKPLASRTGGTVNNANSPSRDQLKVASAPGQIAGYVVDPSGAVVSDARITIKAANAQVTATAMTNSQGAWLIAGLPSGNYKAQAEATGFRTTVLDLNYDANQPSMYSFTLSPGSVSETVEVAAQEAQAETSSASTIANRENSQPSVNGRDLKQMDTLSRRGLPRWAINAAGALQRSFDQGQTWQTVDVNANLLSANAASLLISANAPQAKSKDSDKALKQKVAPLTFRALAAVGADVWAGGSAGSLYHSQDAGNHWIRVVPASASVALTGDILTLEFADPQHGKISTSTSELWTTADAGQTWQKQ